MENQETIETEFLHDAKVYAKKLDQAIAEQAQSSIVEKKKRARNYLSSEMLVRPCTASCPKRSTCKDYLTHRVIDNDPCKPELSAIKKGQVALRKGDLETIKAIAGEVIFSLIEEFKRCDALAKDQELLIEEGFTPSGQQYTKKVLNPLLPHKLNIAKNLDISLNNFLATPKSLKDAPPQVPVNIGFTFEVIQQRAIQEIEQREIKTIQRVMMTHDRPKRTHDHY